MALGDEVQAHPTEDGRIAVLAQVRSPLLGLIPRRRTRMIGHFGPQATKLLRPELERGDGLRLRIVGLTPEFLAGPQGAEVHVSVWVRP